MSELLGGIILLAYIGTFIMAFLHTVPFLQDILVSLVYFIVLLLVTYLLKEEPWKPNNLK